MSYYILVINLSVSIYILSYIEPKFNAYDSITNTHTYQSFWLLKNSAFRLNRYTLCVNEVRIVQGFWSQSRVNLKFLKSNS